jgi:acyl-coenzyme A thioesterase PaaI-like protein
MQAGSFSAHTRPLRITTPWASRTAAWSPRSWIQRSAVPSTRFRPPGRVFTTLELNVNFIRPITDDVGPLRCEARALHVGKRVGTAEGRVVDSRGKLYAHGTTTMIAIDPKPTLRRRRRA